MFSTNTQMYSVAKWPSQKIGGTHYADIRTEPPRTPTDDEVYIKQNRVDPCTLADAESIISAQL